MAKYKVKRAPIRHNGKIYIEGSIIDLNDKDAKRLENFVDLIPETSTKTQANKTQSKTQTKIKTSTTKAESKNQTKTTNTDGKDSNNNGGNDDK